MTDIRACYLFCYADFVICMVDKQGATDLVHEWLGGKRGLTSSNAPNNLLFRFGTKRGDQLTSPAFEFRHDPVVGSWSKTRPFIFLLITIVQTGKALVFV